MATRWEAPDKIGGFKTRKGHGKVPSAQKSPWQKIGRGKRHKRK